MVYHGSSMRRYPVIFEKEDKMPLPCFACEDCVLLAQIFLCSRGCDEAVGIAIAIGEKFGLPVILFFELGNAVTQPP
jgi:hypothetical protein